MARRFGDRAYVDSICKPDWSLTFRGLLETLASDSTEVCLDGELPFDGAACNSPCALVETLNDTRPCEEDPLCPSDRCPVASADRLDRLEPCRDPSSGAECVPLKRDLGTAMVDGVERRLCLVRQAARDPSSFRCSGIYNDGWTYSPSDWADCQLVTFLYTGPGTRRLLAWDTAASLICPP